MGWALPPRRYTGLSVLGLEVFRSLTCGRCSEDRRPAPPVSSGATPEYDRSRQSTDSSVRRSRRRDLSALRHADDPPPPASNRGHHRRAADDHPGHEDRVSTQHLYAPPGATSEEAAPAAGERRRSRREPEGARQTALSSIPGRSRGAPLPSALGSGRQAIRDQMRAPATSGSSTATQGVHGRSSFMPSASLRPDFPERVSRRVTARATRYR
jgi:hypothetical protein